MNFNAVFARNTTDYNPITQENFSFQIDDWD